MQTEALAISRKQLLLLEAVRDSPYTGVEEIFLIGAIGTSKTFGMAYCHINVAWQFEKCIIPVARKDAAEHQIGTFSVYVEVLDKMGFIEGKDYTLRQATNDLQIRFANKSIIKFIGMNQSRDRRWSKLKITATMAGVDEVDDVDEEGYNTLASRTGRRNESGAPRCTISACNPNDRWTKDKVYLPWLKSIGRRPPGMEDEEWDAIEPLPKSKVVIEFNMEDSFLYPTGYYDRYLEFSREWQERFLFNNWFYVDDANSLFKSRAMDRLTIHKLKVGERYISVDPNAGGKDRACILLWEGDTIVDIELYTTPMLEKLAQDDEKNPTYNYGAIIGRLTIEMAKRERVGMRNIVGDVVGVGQGWLTYMLSQGYGQVEQFRSGDAPMQTAAEKAKNIRPPYFDLRSQMFYLWSLDVQNAKTFFYADTPHLATLKKELQLHEADSTSKVIRVTSKDDIRLLLGGSPDVADAGMMGYWLRYKGMGQSFVASQRASVGKSYDEYYNGGNGF